MLLRQSKPCRGLAQQHRLSMAEWRTLSSSEAPLGMFSVKLTRHSAVSFADDSTGEGLLREIPGTVHPAAANPKPRINPAGLILRLPSALRISSPEAAAGLGTMDPGSASQTP